MFVTHTLFTSTMYSVHFYELSPLIGTGIPSQLHPTQTRMKLSSTLRYLEMGVGLKVYGQNSRTKTSVKRCTSIFLGLTALHFARTHRTQTLLRLERALVSVILLLRLNTALLLLLCSALEQQQAFRILISSTSIFLSTSHQALCLALVSSR